MTVLDPTQHDCGCGGAAAGSGGTPTGQHWCSAGTDLPVNPFEALRVTYGMLLGEQDFRVLLGNPRGKLMLHNAWLHGSGVVWGMRVKQAGDELRVQPGLALDRIGRELRIEADQCVSLEAWATDWVREHPGTTAISEDRPAKSKPKPHSGGKTECETRELRAWVVADFSQCADRPVPALADPCDVTRKHNDYSRVVETARVSLVAAPPPDVASYHRVRVLLGLDTVDDDQDEAGQQAVEALADVEGYPVAERAQRLLWWFRGLAAEDEMELAPHPVSGDPCPPLTPVSEEDASVLLAEVCIEVTVEGGCISVGEAEVDCGVRSTLLPTQVIQEALCGQAPSVLEQDGSADAGGPRLIRDSVEWTSDHHRVSFRVTKPLAPGSTEGAIRVGSLANDGRGWATDDVERVSVSSDGLTVRVYLDRAPTYELVRLIIRGTGRRALYGADPRVPFAGIEAGPPGSEDDGHDAVVTERIGVPGSHQSSGKAGS
jgi:hypothetical protein